MRCGEDGESEVMLKVKLADDVARMDGTGMMSGILREKSAKHTHLWSVSAHTWPLVFVLSQTPPARFFWLCKDGTRTVTGSKILE